MQPIQDLAIVLRWVPYEERHRVVTALTENYGKISALARNSIQSRRFGGSLEPFSASLWTFVERNGADLYRVEEAQIRRSFEGIRKNFEHLSLASVFNELMIRLAPEREPCPDLFRLHSNALAALEELDPKLDQPDVLLSLLIGYMGKVLQWSGNQPQLQRCLSCSTPLEDFDPRAVLSCQITDASWLCANCGHKRVDEGQGFNQRFLRVSALALRDFFIGLTTPIKQIPQAMQATPHEHRALFAYLEALFIYHIPGFDQKPLKALRFLGLG